MLDAAKEAHLWAESYERDLRDVLALQAEVAQAIAREIRVKLTAVDQARVAEVHSVKPDAYEAYLRGRYHWNRRSGESLPKAVQYSNKRSQKIQPMPLPTQAWPIACPYSGIGALSPPTKVVARQRGWRTKHSKWTIAWRKPMPR